MLMTQNEVGEDILKSSRKWNELEKRKVSLNSKAMNALFCALNKKEFHRVSNCSNAYEIWRKLEIVLRRLQTRRNLMKCQIWHLWQLEMNQMMNLMR